MVGPGAAAARGLIAVAVLGAGAWAQSGADQRDAPHARGPAQASSGAVDVAHPRASGGIGAEELLDPVAREWCVRELASGEDAAWERLFELLSSGESQRVRLAFDAAERVLRAAPSRAHERIASRMALLGPEGERADVRLARIRVLEAARLSVRWIACFEVGEASEARTPFHPDYALDHASPLVRAASARLLRFEHDAEWALERLLERLVDADERVVHDAAASLALRVADGTASEDALARAWDALGRDADPDVREAFLLLIEAARCPAEALAPLATTVRRAGAPWRGAVEALRLRAGEAGDAETLLADGSTLASEHAALAGLFERAAKAARVHASALGGLAFAAFEADPHGERGAYALAVALEALGAREVAERARESAALDDAAHALLFESLRGRPVELAGVDVEPWLDPGARELELRRAVVEWLGGALLAPEGGALAAALARALEDPSPEVAKLAFVGLCDAERAADWASALRAAWSRFGDAERLELAARLPRSRPLPEFGDEWWRLAERGGDEQGAVLELIAAFAPDAEWARSVERWIDDALRRMPEGRPPRAEELRLAGLVRTLGKLAPGGAVRELDGVARWASGRSDEVGKAALFVLGQSESGRATLTGWLSPQAPSRLRIEAALMLAPHGSALAVRSLVDDFARSDLQLKGRALDALGGLEDARALEFVRAVASDPRAELQLRLRALGALARRSPPHAAALEAATRDPHFELSVAAWRLYAGAGGESARAALERRLAHLAGALAAPPGADHELLAAERAELLRVAADVALRSPAVVAEWRAHLDRRAALDLRERFTDAGEPRPEFSYGGELAFGRALARERELRAALGAEGLWRRWDASVLDALGAAACDEGDLVTGRELLAAGVVALLGELDGEVRRTREFELRHRQLAAAERAGDWEACAALADVQLDAVRARRVGPRTVERLLGGFEPAALVDGVARLAAAAHQAHARVALSAGDLDAVRLQREHAAKHALSSQQARAALERLDAELRARDGAGK